MSQDSVRRQDEVGLATRADRGDQKAGQVWSEIPSEHRGRARPLFHCPDPITGLQLWARSSWGKCTPPPGRTRAMHCSIPYPGGYAGEQNQTRSPALWSLESSGYSQCFSISLVLTLGNRHSSHLWWSCPHSASSASSSFLPPYGRGDHYDHRNIWVSSGHLSA